MQKPIKFVSVIRWTKLYLSNWHSKNDYQYIPWYPPEHSSEGYFDKKSSSVAVLQVSPLLASAFAFKITAPPSLNPLNTLYYLQCNFIERKRKTTLKQLVYLHVSLLKEHAVPVENLKNHWLHRLYLTRLRSKTDPW